MSKHVQTSIIRDDHLSTGPEANVALHGPRQVGKTTLAVQIAATRPSIYLDLKRAEDRLQLEAPAWWLAS